MQRVAPSFCVSRKWEWQRWRWRWIAIWKKKTLQTRGLHEGNATIMVWFCRTVLDKWQEHIVKWGWLTMARMEMDYNMDKPKTRGLHVGITTIMVWFCRTVLDKWQEYIMKWGCLKMARKERFSLKVGSVRSAYESSGPPNGSSSRFL